MSEIEKMKRYIERTKSPEDRWSLSMSDWLALAGMWPVSDAVALAYNYGKAKGYRAAKKAGAC